MQDLLDHAAFFDGGGTAQLLDDIFANSSESGSSPDPNSPPDSHFGLEGEEITVMQSAYDEVFQNKNLFLSEHNPEFDFQQALSPPPPPSVNYQWADADSWAILQNLYADQGGQNLYNMMKQGSPLEWAVRLFSKTWMTQIQKPTAVCNESLTVNQNELGDYMSKALRALANALETPGGAQRDDVLMAVLILTNYEVCPAAIRHSRASTINMCRSFANLS